MQAIAQSLSGGRRKVLDLGGVRNGTVNFFAEFACKLYVADAVQTLAAAPDGEDEVRSGWQALASFLDEFVQPAELDVVLCWDLLDYLSEAELRELGRCLSRYCAPGALMYVIVADRQTIPEQPMRFDIVDVAHLRCEAVSEGIRNAPRHPPGRLLKQLPDFRLHRSFMLSNGRQEHLLAFQG